MSQTLQTNGQPAADGRPAWLRAFGFPDSAARVVVVDRDVRWRLGRAAPTLIAGLGLAALAAVVPPHLPWAAGGVIVTLVLAVRRLRERRTLMRLDGTCPACAAPIAVTSPSRLASPHRVTCSGCGRVLDLALSDAPGG